MREFVYGTDRQYEMLKNALEDGLCHVFSRCALPASFSRTVCRIGFEHSRTTNGYILYIDRGITCSDARADVTLKEWLSSGSLTYLDFNDLKEFLKGLTYLY